jgi:hypothetical protein
MYMLDGANALLDSVTPDESEVVFISSRNEQVPALVSVWPAAEPFWERLYIVKDLRVQKRVQELELLGQAFYAIAAQTLTPLTLATTWLKRVTNTTAANISETVEKVRQQLAKVQLTMQRLKLYNRRDAVQALDLVPLSVSAELRSTLAEFPTEERMQIRVTDESMDADLVCADVYCFGFVLRTILSYLLQLPHHYSGTAVDIVVHRRNDHVVLRFTGREAARTVEVDRITGFVRHDIILGEDILSDFMRKMHGSYNMDVYDNNLEFELELPALRRTQ